MQHDHWKGDSENTAIIEQLVASGDVNIGNSHWEEGDYSPMFTSKSE